MQLTPKPREALLAAFHAPAHTLIRCAGGFRNPEDPRAAPVTRRTANELSNAMLAEFNDRDVPSALTLTARGVAEALRLQAESLAAAA